MTLKRTLVTNDDGVTRETLVDRDRVQPEDERAIWARHRVVEWHDKTHARQPGIDRSGWIGIGAALAAVALLALAAFLVLKLSG